MKKISCIFILALIALSACTFQTKHRGYIFPENLESEIASVKTTAALEDKLGSPQVKTVYGTEVWVYYGADENYHGPFPVSYDKKTVLLAWTDGAGKITKTKILRDADLPTVKPASGETEIPAAIELNALQELFNNIGRFSPAGLGQ
jgi:outer membrane protein assembly factor BamE (lipoprotein component of BamABCDE complex)